MNDDQVHHIEQSLSVQLPSFYRRVLTLPDDQIVRDPAGYQLYFDPKDIIRETRQFRRAAKWPKRFVVIGELCDGEYIMIDATCPESPVFSIQGAAVYLFERLSYEEVIQPHVTADAWESLQLQESSVLAPSDPDGYLKTSLEHAGKGEKSANAWTGAFCLVSLLLFAISIWFGFPCWIQVAFGILLFSITVALLSGLFGHALGIQIKEAEQLLAAEHERLQQIAGGSGE